MSDRKNDHKKPFSEYDIRTRMRFRKIVKHGKIPEELIGTDAEKVLKKQIRLSESTKKGWSIISGFIKKHKIRYGTGILAVIAVNALAIITPIITGEIIDMLRGAEATGMDETISRLANLCIIIVYSQVQYPWSQQCT